MLTRTILAEDHKLVLTTGSSKAMREVQKEALRSQNIEEVVKQSIIGADSEFDQNIMGNIRKFIDGKETSAAKKQRRNSTSGKI